MHSSKDPASRSCTFRAMFRAFLFLALCVCITMLLNYALIPPSSVRINLHNLGTGSSMIPFSSAPPMDSTGLTLPRLTRPPEPAP